MITYNLTLTEAYVIVFCIAAIVIMILGTFFAMWGIRELISGIKEHMKKVDGKQPTADSQQEEKKPEIDKKDDPSSRKATKDEGDNSHFNFQHFE